MNKAILLILLSACEMTYEDSATISPINAPNGSVTIQVPMFGAVANSVFPAQFAHTNTFRQGISFPIPPIPVGSVIIGARARVQDSTIGPTRVFLALADQVDNSIDCPDTGPSETSSGSGAFQTLDLPTTHVPVINLHTYYVGVFVATGNVACSVSAIEIVYMP